ncbi:MAG: FAD-binding oxidoreductase, partial [Longimicrobiales bacterium]|nr:FAD-binding oxidoreductase [Longimicrobiales bacterium]
MADTGIAPGDPGLQRRLRTALEGEVRFDAFTRGLYSTDASHYQIEPLGVVFPRTVADVEATLEIAREDGVPVIPRGGGTSQCGQAIGRAVVMDTSRHLTEVGDGVDARSSSVPTPEELGLVDVPGGGGGTAVEIDVAPGVVLDHLNRLLSPHGLWFPVDPSTGSRATLGGMAGN